MRKKYLQAIKKINIKNIIFEYKYKIIYNKKIFSLNLDIISNLNKQFFFIFISWPNF